MSNDNVFPLRPSPKDASDELVNKYWEMAVQLMQDEAKRLLNLETFNNAPLVEELSQVGMESYLDCNGKRCYRPMGQGLQQRQLNKIRENYEYRRHVESVYREITERRLTELDPDWRDHYKTFEAAELAYWRELQVKRDAGSQFEPPQ